MFVPTKTKDQGFIALITAILLSMALLVMIVAVSFEGFASRYTILESEFKEESDYLAEACVQTAILKYYQDKSYTGNMDWINVGESGCLIYSISGTAAALEIRTSASSSASHTNLLVTLNTNDFPDYAVMDWQEVISHP